VQIAEKQEKQKLRIISQVVQNHTLNSEATAITVVFYAKIYISQKITLIKLHKKQACN
jgi:hypothetical protein